MSETVVQTHCQIEEHLNRYRLLFEGGKDQDNSEDLTSTSSVQASAHNELQLRKNIVESIRLKKSHKITARQLNDITHTHKTTKKREHRLKRSKDVGNALTAISSKEHAIQHSTTLQDVDKVHELRMQTRSILRSFEHSNAHLKERHTRNLRNLRALTKLGAAERRYAQESSHDND
ncbi:hypothetical protein BGZ76_001817, partial [Entomortierella beljakovae]